MKPPRKTPKFSDQGGFILATVLVFLVVLSLTAFLAARLTRTDVQVVNNLQNEREAFAIAESGVDEAVYRMSLAMGDKATVSGVNGGTAFNASLSPVVPGRAAPGGVTPYGLDSGLRTRRRTCADRSVEPAAPRPERTATSFRAFSRLLRGSFIRPRHADADTNAVSVDSTANLTIGWDICANNTDPGCAAGANTIRQLPLSHPRNVVKIVSTGQSGNAAEKDRRQGHRLHTQFGTRRRRVARAGLRPPERRRLHERKHQHHRNRLDLHQRRRHEQPALELHGGQHRRSAKQYHLDLRRHRRGGGRKR